MSEYSKIFSTIVLVSVVMGGAASNVAALSQYRRTTAAQKTLAASYPLPHPVSFRDVNGRGLLVRTWVNGVGPFNFAIDTGAGATIIAPRVAEEAHVARTNRSATIAGLSGANTVAQHASIDNLAIGDSENRLPAKGENASVGSINPSKSSGNPLEISTSPFAGKRFSLSPIARLSIEACCAIVFAPLRPAMVALRFVRTT